jgi:glutaconate CoA-transferase subunit B
MTLRAFTQGELMVAAAAREIRDGELVFVGMRLPMIAFAVAKRTHAPRATGLFENGVIRDEPVSQLLYTMGDPSNLYRATFCGDMISVMSLRQQGRRDLTLVGLISDMLLDQLIGAGCVSRVGEPEIGLFTQSSVLIGGVATW